MVSYMLLNKHIYALLSLNKGRASSKNKLVFWSKNKLIKAIATNNNNRFHQPLLFVSNHWAHSALCTLLKFTFLTSSFSKGSMVTHNNS